MKKGIRVWRILLVASMVCFLFTGLVALFTKQEITITKNICENKDIYSDVYELIPNDGIYNNTVGFDLSNYSAIPGDFLSWKYVENEICFEVFAEEGLYPDSMNLYGLNYTNLDWHIDYYEYGYDNEFLVDGVVCEGYFEKDYGNYYKRETIERTLNNVFVRMPPFNYSKIVFKIEEDYYKKPFQIIRNENNYFTSKIKFYYEKNVCEDVEVENDKYNLGFSKICYDLCEIKGINKSSSLCTFRYTGGSLGCSQSETFNSYEKKIYWLDKNAECLEFCKYNWITKQTLCDRDEERINYCSKYKIGSYTIEVKT
jgi:hypothetical protein